jgi:DNA-binding transcriptional LysR family regulator
MELRQLKYFICLYEEGSATRAAQRLNIVQPALSTQIAKLEDEFGQVLFERTPKGMVPTSVGRQAYRTFQPLVRKLFEARNGIVNLAGEISGRVSVGLIESANTTALPDVLQFFSQTHPEVEIYVTTGYTPDLIDSVLNGVLDFAVINQNQRIESLVSTPVVDEGLLVVTGASNQFLDGGTVSFEELLAAKLILPSKRHGLRVLIDQVFAGRGLSLEPHFEVDDLSAIQELVRRSDWVSILPVITIYSGLEAGELRVRPLELPGITRHVVCVHSHSRPLSPPARLFVESIRRNMQAKVEAVETYKTL